MWSIDRACVAANDQCNSLKNEIPGRSVGAVGATSAPATLMLAQIAQKSSPRPFGFFWRGEVGRSASLIFSGAVATAFPAAAATAQLLELPAKRSRWPWPKESTNWHASANSASDA